MKLTYTSIKYAALIVLLHALVNVLHGLAHFENSIWLSLFGNAYVTVVILLAPLLALLLLYSRWQKQGAWLLTLSMLGSLIFGVWNHFLVPGQDNVAQVPPGAWHLPFLITSILLALLEAVGIIIGIWYLSSSYSGQAIPRQPAFGGSSGPGTPDSRA
jgi:hypothetical protein